MTVKRMSNNRFIFKYIPFYSNLTEGSLIYDYRILTVKNNSTLIGEKRGPLVIYPPNRVWLF
jgi:hypothetical protein